MVAEKAGILINQDRIDMQRNSRSRKRARDREMTPETANLIVEMLNIEDALSLRPDPKGVLLAAALATYRHLLEREGGFVRVQRDSALEWLKHIEIQQGNGWLKLIDTRVKSKRK